jgi:hypothetical protein
MALTLAAAPDLAWALLASSGALYFAWFVAFLPLALARFAATLLALRLWFPARRSGGWRAAWALELAHSAVLLLLIASMHRDTFRHTGYADDTPPLFQGLVLAWPLAAGAASVWALLRPPARAD